MRESTVDMSEMASYQYPKTMSQANICRNVSIDPLEGLRVEEGKTRRTKHLQDHLWQDIWWFLCQMIQKLTTQLLTLCLLAFMTWMLGLFVVASVLDTVPTPRPRRIVSPSSSTKPKYQSYNSVPSAQSHHQPNSQPFFQRQTNIPILQWCRISPRSSTIRYVNSILSAQEHKRLHILESVPDERHQKLSRGAFFREWGWSR